MSTETTRDPGAPTMEEMAARAHAEQNAEIERLRRIETAARTYYEDYAVDEADDEAVTFGVTHRQHEAAKALKEALGL